MWGNAWGDVCAVITRNSYGCRVLNTSKVMFVDIDLPEPKAGGGFFKRLFGKPEIPRTDDAQAQAMTRIENWTRNNGAWGWRVYRTHSGLRLPATQGVMEAGSEESNAVFEALGADPLYRKLCKTQKCFRARLTPKPWRCGIRARPERWPWLAPKQEQRFHRWEAKYAECSARWATCRFLRQIGSRAIAPEVQTILRLHDEKTRAESNLPLA